MELSAAKRSVALLTEWVRSNGSTLIIERPLGVSARSGAGSPVTSVGMFAGEKDYATNIESHAHSSSSVAVCVARASRTIPRRQAASGLRPSSWG